LRITPLACPAREETRMSYQAPVDDIMLALKCAADVPGLAERGVYDGLDLDTIRAIVEEAGRFAAAVLEPINASGDRTGCRLAGGKVETPPGWDEAYRAFAEGGWNALPCPEAWGGQGLPEIVSMAACEIWNSANLAFGLCPLLTQGAVGALDALGSDELKARYLPKMVTGEWTGTMNLTEPHAGSDLGALKTRAERRADGTYRLYGTKIFITFGEHELSQNIIHMVLARLTDAPAGTKGISLFLVPKVLVNPDGSLGRRNDVVCAGIEHKLGIHGSPTCTMAYGEQDGAVGYLVGEENRGLAAMFLMMNAARLAVGVQGVAIAERATQRAIAYARERKQGHGPDGPDGGMVAIIQHADIRRSLITMKALTQAARMICLATASEIDISHRAKSESERQRAALRAALLTPVAKAFSTDIGCEVASLGLQVHGGTGFIEETGAAQYFRDARILPIYEGTNGIQAIDLVLRKLPLEGGRVLAGYIGELERTVAQVNASNQPAFGDMGKRLGEAVEALKAASRWMGAQLLSNREAALAGAAPYSRLFGIAAGGIYLARGALAAVRDGNAGTAVSQARYFAENVSTGAAGLALMVTGGSHSILSVAPDDINA
jgi:alkylation response protein AidB-like acyl-CoA dehydrogenase